MTNFFFNNTAEPKIDVWVAIGVSGNYTEPASFKAPVLDLYGEKDLPAVLENAQKRAAAISRVRGSAQIQVGGADHFFTSQETELVTQIRQFLDLKLR